VTGRPGFLSDRGLLLEVLVRIGDVTLACGVGDHDVCCRRAVDIWQETPSAVHRTLGVNKDKVVDGRLMTHRVFFVFYMPTACWFRQCAGRRHTCGRWRCGRLCVTFERVCSVHGGSRIEGGSQKLKWKWRRRTGEMVRGSGNKK